MKKNLEVSILNVFGIIKKINMNVDYNDIDFIFTGLNRGFVYNVLEENGFFKHYDMDYMVQKDLSKRDILKYKIILNSKHQKDIINCIWIIIKDLSRV